MFPLECENWKKADIYLNDFGRHQFCIYHKLSPFDSSAHHHQQTFLRQPKTEGVRDGGVGVQRHRGATPKCHMVQEEFQTWTRS